MISKVKVAAKRKKAATLEEPEYRFVKGAGWVPSLQRFPEITKQIGKYMVTLTKKRPEEGEYYFEQSPGRKKDSHELIMDAMNDSWWSVKFERETPEELVNNFPQWHKSNRTPRTDTVVIKFELIDGR